MPQYTADEVHEVFDVPAEQIQAGLARWAHERRPEIRRAITNLTGRPAVDDPSLDGLEGNVVN